MTKDYYSEELSCVEQEDLARAARAIGGKWGNLNTEGRYNFYRRKGYSVADALAFTRAWCRNSAEQKARRVGHDTGAE